MEAKIVKRGHRKSIEKHDGEKVMQAEKRRFMRNPPAPLKETAKQARTRTGDSKQRQYTDTRDTPLVPSGTVADTIYFYL